jgi:hypothetical protein
MPAYNCVWKEGCWIELKMNKPIIENIFLYDLVTGKKYLVHPVCKSNIRTFPVGTLTELELKRLRVRMRCTSDAFSRPFDLVVF